jgi:2-dehydropantoate 2-reductase
MAADIIYIVGSGAIGKSLAVFLQREGKRVILLRGSVDNKPSHMETMSIELNDGSVVEEKIEVSTASNFPAIEGIVVLTNKSFGNRGLSEILRNKTGNSPLVILQNGLRVEQPFVDSGFQSVYRCVLFVTSQQTNAGRVRFKPVAACPIGVIKGRPEELDKITRTLTSRYFQFVPEAAIQPVIWKKAIINCAFNSICPLIEADNGIFHRNPVALKIAEEVIRECLTIAAAMGIHLVEAEVVQNLLTISSVSDGQLISTLQDINNGRPTEIDTLNFEVVRIARQLGMGESVTQTKLLGELIKFKEGSGLSPRSHEDTKPH